jgi:uncharacterized membrane protein YvlD (DUF360 family)
MLHDITEKGGFAVMNIIGAIVRFVVSAVVLLITAWLVPGFSVGGFGSALLLAIVIALLGWLVESMFGRNINPFGRGIVGFLLSAIVIWVGQFFVVGVRASMLGALLAALVIGIIDLFVPVNLFGRDGGKTDRKART